MEDQERKSPDPVVELQNEQRSVEMQSVLELFTREADEDAAAAHAARTLSREHEVFERINGIQTSVYEINQRINKIIEDLPQNHEPKFRLFFAALGKLAGWTEEQINSYHKPPLAAQTINSVIYGRFPKDVIQHIHRKNPYIKWCTRLHKNYLFLSEDGIILLERFIHDAVTVMRKSTTVYDFRVKHAEEFGSAFQPVLFEKYLGLLID
jgi:hypothetical protein